MVSLYFRYNLHSIIGRDYELLRRFKTTTTLLHDLSDKFLKKMKFFMWMDDTLKQSQ